MLPKIIGRFASAYPNVALEVFSDLSSKLLSAEQRSQYDLILALHDEQSAKRRGLIRSDELVWVGSAEHELQKQQPLPLVLAQDGCLYRKRTLHGLNKIGRAWRIVHTNPDLSGIEAALQEGLGITVLARSTVSGVFKNSGNGNFKRQFAHPRRNRYQPAIQEEWRLAGLRKTGRIHSRQFGIGFFNNA